VADPRACIDAAGRLGRAFGGMRTNRKRLGRAIDNLRVAYPGWCADRLYDHALASYGHLFMLGAELIQSPAMLTDDSWHQHLELGALSPAVRALVESRPCLLITGHCGNWEMLGYTLALLGFPVHALYRPMDLPPFDRYVRVTRQRRGMTLVDKFGALRQLPALVGAGAPVGFVADQNGGDRGLFVPFFNRLTSTYKSIGLLALQFNATIICGLARRLPLAQRAHPRGLGYRIEMVDVFGPEDWCTHPDPLFYLTARYRRAVETMVKRAPEQYLWMHRIWRSRPRHERLGKPFPDALGEKLRLLPWLGEGDLEALKSHSAQDARTLAATGLDRLS
jgi:KDO2-lipid IV(A) lauroyltransferase